MNERAVALISLSALKHNLERIRSLASNSATLAMIKGNGYGHGLLRVAKALSEADGFGVTCLTEAMLLRQAGIKQPILIMLGFATAEELLIVSEQQLSVVIHNQYQIDILKKLRLPKPVQVWIKIDTGMHRLGFAPSKVDELIHELSTCSNIQQPVVWMTHFASADNLKVDYTQQQINCFYELIPKLPGLKSLANSAAIMTWPQIHADWVRPGITLYGVAPDEMNIGANLNLKPVMTLISELISIHTLKKGDSVGYHRAWHCPEDMPVGIIALGYADGYSRHAKNGTPVLVNGHECALVGHVSMDMMAVDLRTYPQAKVGDKVILWGPELPIEYIARSAETIPHELFCNLSQRVKFIEVN